MASQEKVTLNINAKNKAKGVLNSVKNQIIGIGAAYLGWKFVSSMLGDTISAALHTEKVYNDLSASIKRHGGVWEDVEKSLRSYTDTMQKATGVSDELIAKGLQAFIDFGATTAEAMGTMNVALDLAAGSNIELTAAVDLLAKAQVGYTGTLSRYGIIIDEAIPASEKFAAAIEQINEKFGGAARARMDSTAVKIDLLKETWGDLQEKFGEVLIESDLLIDSLTTLTELLDTTVEIMKGNISAWDLFKQQILFMVGLHGLWFDAIIANQEAMEGFTKDGLLKAHGATEDLTNKFAELITEMTRFDPTIKTFVIGWQMIDGKLKEVTQSFIDLQHEQGELFTGTLDLQDAYSRGWSTANEEVVDSFGEYAVTVARSTTQTTKHQIDSTRRVTAAGQKGNQQLKAGIQAVGNAMSGAMGNAVNNIVGSLGFLQTESKGVFKNMAADFMKFFITEVLTMAAKVLVVKLLKILAGIFDTRANDMMAATQGRHFIQWFTHGAVEQLEANNLGALIVPRVAIPNFPRQAGGGSGGGAQIIINFNAPVSDEQFIRDSVIPVLEQAIFDRETIIVKEDSNVTGREQFAGAQF